MYMKVRIFVIPLSLVLLCILYGCEQHVPYRHVILITFDSARLDVFPRWCGNPYGNPIDLPNINRFCLQSKVYSRAYTPFPATAPAIASIYTGLSPFHHRIDMQSPVFLSPGFLTLAEALKQKRIRTILIAGNNWFIQKGSGYDQGFETLVLPKEASHARNPRHLVHLFFRHWKTCHYRCFIHLHLFQPHEPYGAPGKYFDPPKPQSSSFLSPRWIKPPIKKHKKNLLQHYLAGLRWADDALGELFSGIEQDARHDRTLLILSSDHGEGFGEHGFWGHNNAVFNESVHIPFIVHTPDHRYQEQNHLVSLSDLYATVLDAFGVHLQTTPFSSVSFLNHQTTGRKHPPGLKRSYVIIKGHDRDDSVAIVAGRYKLMIHQRTQLARLYDILSDPFERRNVITRQYKYAMILQQQMNRFIMDFESPTDQISERFQQPDTRQIRKLLRSLGYTDATFVRPVPSFFLHPVPIPWRKIRFHWRIIRDPQSNDLFLELINTGQVAWPSTKLPGAPFISLRCISQQDKETYLLPHDVYPGERVRFKLQQWIGSSPHQALKCEFGPHILNISLDSHSFE